MQCVIEQTPNSTANLMRLNDCRLTRRIYSEFALLGIGELVDLFDISTRNSTFLLIPQLNDCVHLVSKFTHTHPVCSKFPCKDFSAMEISSHIFKSVYLCMPTTYLVDGYHSKYEVFLDIPKLDFRFSFCTRSPCTDDSHHNKYVNVSLVLDNRVPLSLNMYCLNLQKCFYLSPYCESFIIKSNSIPTAYTMNMKDDVLFMHVNNMTTQCATFTFRYDQFLYYYPIYFNLLLSSDAVNPPDHTNVFPYRHYSAVSGRLNTNPINFNYEWDCNYENYKTVPHLCSIISVSDDKNFTLEYHIPSVFNLKVSSIVSEFFDKLFFEFENIFEYTFRLLVSNLVKYTFVLFEYLLSFLPGGIYFWLDVFILFIVFSFLITSLIARIVLSILFSALKLYL